MTQLDPHTRKLSQEELSEVLRDLRARNQSADPGLEKTLVWQRPRAKGAPASRPSQEPATELAVIVPPPMTRPKFAVEPVTPSDIPGLQSRRSLWGVLVGLTLLTLIWITSSGSPPAPTSSTVAPVRASTGPKATQVAVVAQETEGTSPAALPSVAHLSAPSRRAAVDQLISGHMQEALDSYRALAQAHAQEPAFAFVVAQLERELAACRSDPQSCSR